MAEESQYEDAIRNVNALKKLVASEGWQILLDIAKEQMHNRREKIVLQPLSSMDEALPQEFMKGEVAGIQVLLSMPEVQIESSESILEALRRKGRKDDGEEEEDA
jgi:hypothetical protein